MEELRQFENKLSNKLNRKAYNDAIIQELKRIKESGASKKDIETALAYIREFSKSINKKQVYTANDLTDKQTEMARLIRVHQDRGYEENSKILDYEKMKPYLNQKLRYKNGLVRSLTDAFGDIDENLSNEAFSVYRKAGEKPTVVFRGSRTNPNDRATLQDWKQNALNLVSTAKKTKDFTEIESNLKNVNEKYGGFKEFLGYSKGGGLALEFAKEYKVPFTVFNPHINGGHDLRNIKGTIIRTAADPASIIGAFKQQGKDVAIKTIPSLIGNEDPLNSHDINNFWNDTLRRQNHLEIAPKIQALGTMKSLKREYTNIDDGIELQPRNLLDTAFKQRKLISTNLDDLTTSSTKFANTGFADDYSVVPLRQTRVNRASGVQDTAFRQRRLTTTSLDTGTELMAKPAITEMPKVITQTRQMKPTNGRITPTRGVQDTAFQPRRLTTTTNVGTVEPTRGVEMNQLNPVRQDTAFQPRRLTTTSLDNSFFSEFNPKLIDAYKAMTPTIRNATQENLSNRITSTTNNLDDYAVHYDDSIKSQMFSSVRGGIGSALTSGVKIGAGGLIGAGLGFGVSELANALHLDGNNPYVNSALTGGLVGGLTEGAGIRMAGAGLTALASGSRILASGISGLGGAVIGTLATQQLQNLFSQDANPYVKDIISNIAGGEIGLGASLAIGGGVSAGLATATGVELGVAGTNWFDPVGWGALVGAGITAIGGGIAGAIEGKQESDAKTAQDALEAQETKEITYAGSADQLQDQYSYMRSYLTELGMSPTVIGQMNNDLITRLLDPNVKPLTPAQFQNVFNTNLDQYSIDGFTYSTSQPSNQQQLQKKLDDTSLVHNSMLNSLVNAMNSHGAGITLPPPQFYTAKTFADTYNSILASNPLAASKVGIPPLPIIGDPAQPDFTSSIPTGLDPTRTLTAEVDIRNQQQGQAVVNSTISSFSNVVSGLEAGAAAILANARAKGLIPPAPASAPASAPVVPDVQAQVATPTPILTGQFTRNDFSDTLAPASAPASASAPVVQAPPPVVQAPPLPVVPDVQAQVSTPAPLLTGIFTRNNYG